MDRARDLILEAIEQGQITAREGARLLDALSGKRAGAMPALRLRLTDLASGRRLLDVALPLQALEAAAELDLRLDSLWDLGANVSSKEILAALRSGAAGLLAETESGGKRLEVLAEPA